MKFVEALISAPVIVSILAASQITLRGRADAQDIVVETGRAAVRTPIDPVFGLMMVGVLLLSGIILVVREIVVETQERKKDDL